MKTMIVRFLPLWAGLLISTFLSAQPAPPLADYTAFLESEIAADRIAGAVSLVVMDGDTLHHGAWGDANRETGEAMMTDRIFHIMSMTKPIVSVAAMMLWEEGKFRLDDPISDYLPGFDKLRVSTDPKAGKDGSTEPARSVPTIRQLFSHTAGFSHGLSGSPLDNDVARALYFSPQKDIASRVQTLTELPLSAQPGTKWIYSASPDVLALLIENLSGQTVDVFLQERLFAPLGMTETAYNLDPEMTARMPALHKVVDGKLVRDPGGMPASGHTVFGGTHGLLSTAADYGKFCQMLLDGGAANGHRFLKAETIELMTQSHTGAVPYEPGKAFGLGFGVVTDTPADGSDQAGRFYWSGAYSTFFFVDPANDLFAVLMTQTAPYTGKYGKAMREYVYGAVKR